MLSPGEEGSDDCSISGINAWVVVGACVCACVIPWHGHLRRYVVHEASCSHNVIAACAGSAVHDSNAVLHIV